VVKLEYYLANKYLKYVRVKINLVSLNVQFKM